MVFGSSGHITIARGNTDLVTNKWTHIAVTLTSSQLKIYIDGELDTTVSQSFNGFSSPLYGSIGNDRRGQSTTGPKWLNGQVGQVRVYTSAITQDQVRQNYNFTKSNYPNGNNGTINGATWNSSGYFQFDGSNDEIDITGEAPYNSLSKQTDTIKSIAGWIKLDSGTRSMMYSVSSTVSGNYYFTCQVRNDGLGAFIQCRNGSPSNQFLDRTTTSSDPDTNWHHYVFQLKDGEREIYIDGVKRTTYETNTGSATSSNWISYPTYASAVKHRIQKAREVQAYYGTGKMSKTKHYTRALTQTEITALVDEGE